MSKSHAKELLQVVHHIFQDAAYAYPTLVGEFVKDELRLRNLVESRGIHALCVDLVAAGKHLDRCLDSGEYKLSGLPATCRYSSRVVIPKFLRGLYLLVFDETGNLKEDCDVQAVCFLRQILYVARKAKLDCSDTAIRNEVADFSVVDAQLPEPEGFWAEENPSPQEVGVLFRGFPRSDIYLKRVAELVEPHLRDDVSTLLMNLDLVSWYIIDALGAYRYQDHRFRHGPGAISEKTGRPNKYCWSNWSNRLESSFPIADCGFHSYHAWADRASKDDIGSQDPASRLISVPKTFTKPRLIAAEPSEHQWCQQNLWHYFEESVRNSWIHDFVRFRDQSRNQGLCLSGSVDGSLATVDLSAASDRVTCHIVGQFFRDNVPLVLALQSTRTRFMNQSLNPSVPAVIPLRKFSTMGSACTFPVQTLIFLGICLAAVATKRSLKVSPELVRSLSGEVAVFGDDIVIPSDSRELLFEALKVLHFKVNLHKSFWTGKFRESCGVDAFRGVNVTPAYWRAPNDGKPESTVSTIEVHNNFHKRWLLRTAGYLATTMQLGSIPVVSMGSGVCGLKSFTRPARPRLTRWNRTLQRAEAFVRRFHTRQQKLPITDDSALLQYFTEQPAPTIIWKGGVAQNPRTVTRTGWVPLDELYD